MSVYSNPFYGMEGEQADMTQPFAAAAVEILLDVSRNLIRPSGAGNFTQVWSVIEPRILAYEAALAIYKTNRNAPLPEPVFILESLEEGLYSSKASFFMERVVLNDAILNLERTPVIIRIGGRTRFAGRVQSQKVTPERVEYHCIDLSVMIDEIPLSGRIGKNGRLDDEGESVLQSLGRSDRGDDGLGPVIDEEAGSRWSWQDLFSYYLRLFQLRSTLLGSSTSQIQGLSSLKQVMLDEWDFSTRRGLFSLAQEVAERGGGWCKIEVEQIIDPANMLGVLNFLTPESAFSGYISVNTAVGIELSSPDFLPYTYQLEEDFGAPTLSWVRSGPALVETTLSFLFNGSYVNIVSGEQGWSRFVFYQDPETVTNLYEGASLENIFGNGSRKEARIHPPVKEIRDGEVIFEDRYSIIFELQNTGRSDGFWKMGSVSWNRADKAQDAWIFEGLESLDIGLDDPLAGLVIRQHSGESLSGSVLDFVASIHIPICLQTQKRELKACRFDAATGAYVTEDDPLSYEEKDEIALCDTKDELRFIERVGFVDGFSRSALSYATDEVRFSISEDLYTASESLLREERKKHRAGSLIIKIPSSHYLNLSALYPARVGDVLLGLENTDVSGIAFPVLETARVLAQIQSNPLYTHLVYGS